MEVVGVVSDVWKFELLFSPGFIKNTLILIGSNCIEPPGEHLVGLAD